MNSLVSQRRGGPGSSVASPEAGFTLIEIMMALMIFAMVILTFLKMRTQAVEDVVSTRDHRIAREIAETYLSELIAGARQDPPERGRTYTVDDYPGYEYQYLIGEAAISDFESRMADQAASASANAGGSGSDRMAWQRERQMLRDAKSRGVTLEDYQLDIRNQELEAEQRIPSESEFEDVAIAVSFNEIRIDEKLPDRVHFMLKAKVSTMALESLTPDRAKDIARLRSGNTGTGEAGGTPGQPGPEGNR